MVGYLHKLSEISLNGIFVSFPPFCLFIELSFIPLNHECLPYILDYYHIPLYIFFAQIALALAVGNFCGSCIPLPYRYNCVRLF